MILKIRKEVMMFEQCDLLWSNFTVANFLFRDV